MVAGSVCLSVCLSVMPSHWDKSLPEDGCDCFERGGGLASQTQSASTDSSLDRLLRDKASPHEKERKWWSSDADNISVALCTRPV